MSNDLDALKPKLDQLWNEFVKDVKKVLKVEPSIETYDKCGMVFKDQQEIAMFLATPAEVLLAMVDSFTDKRKQRIGDIEFDETYINFSRMFEYIREKMPNTYKYICLRVERGEAGIDPQFLTGVVERIIHMNGIMNVDGKKNKLPDVVLFSLLEAEMTEKLKKEGILTDDTN